MKLLQLLAIGSLLLAVACDGDTNILCGTQANAVPCATGQYCVCFAGNVAVPEGDYPSCLQPFDAGTVDSQVFLPSASPGACVACSSSAYCGASRVWNSATCACDPPL